MISESHTKISLLIDRINSISKERGNIDLILKLDSIVEIASEEEQIKALAQVVANLNSYKK